MRFNTQIEQLRYYRWSLFEMTTPELKNEYRQVVGKEPEKLSRKKMIETIMKIAEKKTF